MVPSWTLEQMLADLAPGVAKPFAREILHAPPTSPVQSRWWESAAPGQWHLYYPYLLWIAHAQNYNGRKALRDLARTLWGKSNPALFQRSEKWKTAELGIRLLVENPTSTLRMIDVTPIQSARPVTDYLGSHPCVTSPSQDAWANFSKLVDRYSHDYFDSAQSRTIHTETSEYIAISVSHQTESHPFHRLDESSRLQERQERGLHRHHLCFHKNTGLLRICCENHHLREVIKNAFASELLREQRYFPDPAPRRFNLERLFDPDFTLLPDRRRGIGHVGISTIELASNAVNVASAEMRFNTLLSANECRDTLRNHISSRRQITRIQFVFSIQYPIPVNRIVFFEPPNVSSLTESETDRVIHDYLVNQGLYA